MDYTAFIAAIDFTQALVVIGSASVSLMIFYVAYKGAKIALEFISPTPYNDTNCIDHSKSYDELGNELVVGSQEYKDFRKRMGYD